MGSDHCPSLRKTTAAATTAISTISITTTITAITYLWMCTANHNHITWDRIVVRQNDDITNLKITDICICKKIISIKKWAVFITHIELRCSLFCTCMSSKRKCVQSPYIQDDLLPLDRANHGSKPPPPLIQGVFYHSPFFTPI